MKIAGTAGTAKPAVTRRGGKAIAVINNGIF